MANNRDNFTKTTIDILAKRVGYLCSNPDCKIHTVGPNEKEDKASSIGIAAHITAASAGGPRYDSSLSEADRKHISNGIWLCSNCSIIIDKNPEAYPVTLLKKWKESAESEMDKKLAGKKEKEHKPFIEADLIWSNNGRRNRGMSFEKHKEYSGKTFHAGQKLDFIWYLDWEFSLVLHNNSKYPAYNLKVEPIGDTRFTSLPSLPKVNNIQPFSNINFNTKYGKHFEGDYEKADEILKEKIPSDLNDLQLKITYQDDNRENHTSVVEIKNNEIVTRKE
ncbi:hypothetical protein [Carboxylicivirga caseinilyticus]|uniref:hypothetical protein n=1 Tax=Carboxylicivirga caseinilyticus TaxID=3417572 RepID=UPI003D3368F9|nr:hypothetical protein [Marinilabiliaceae bacterium A049]